ncbi:hypothetical protein [Nocardioides sp.]|uniref:hypothetical protein n=1 Tax=Nocardioides sp. TaxID=35761 RepID=UPI003562F88E
MTASLLGRRCAFAVTSALLATSLTLAPAATAAPVFDNAETTLDPYAYGNAIPHTGNATCSAVPTENETPVPVVENGPAATATGTATATYANSDDGADNATGNATMTATGRVASVGGNPSTIDMTFKGEAHLDNALGTSPNCARNIFAGADLNYEFTVATAGFLTVRMSAKGGYAEIYVAKRDGLHSDSLPFIDLYADQKSLEVTGRAYLTPGTYGGYFEASVGRRSRSSYDQVMTGQLHAEFHVAGSRTAKVKGAGQRFVSLPKARSCAKHSLSPKLTKNKARSGAIKQVRFYVNDKATKKVTKIKRGGKVKLRIADGASAAVRAVVVTKATKAKPSRTYEVKTAYEACS